MIWSWTDRALLLSVNPMNDVIPIDGWAKAEASMPTAGSVEELASFERMLVNLSARLANVAADRVETEIQLAQVALQQFLGFDRSTFAEFQDDGSLTVLSSTAVKGVEPTPLGPLPTQLSWFIARLRAGKPFVVQDAAHDIPPEATGEAEYFKRMGLRSHFSIPLRVGGRIIGAFGFASFNQPRSWPEELMARIRLIGEMFAHAIARKREQEKLLAAMEEVRLLKDRFEQENIYLRHAVNTSQPHGLSSRAPCFISVIKEIAQVSRTNSTVLLLGETGSGKEVLAQAIHDASPRKSRPLIKVNCAVTGGPDRVRTVRPGKGRLYRSAGKAAGPF